eukprot:TRINITY_DN10947_c0_g1_i1.p1 TRINITY_DN10947_c0_g1~~TRINITY_DN10947_c0_g1_i1.p1  ORF type:complete len:224 (+),score=39.29 TRINITY_DN10947_c0_g1_i1:867-1538(+)
MALIGHCVGKLSAQSSHAHFQNGSTGFTVRHYAGDVRYTAEDFVEKNKDTLFNDVVRVAKSSSSKLLEHLFKNDDPDDDERRRPTTTGYKIKRQTKQLVDALMSAEPHYVRCIKSNDNKKANSFATERVEHQIQYLGLVENIKVRRAGFAYRQEFFKFLERFKILSSKTWPDQWTGTDKNGCKAILKSISKMTKLNKEQSTTGEIKKSLLERTPENTLFSLTN